MGHLQEIEQTLRELLAKKDEESLVAWVKERVLESYKNGLAQVGRKATSAGRKPTGSSVNS